MSFRMRTKEADGKDHGQEDEDRLPTIAQMLQGGALSRESSRGAASRAASRALSRATSAKSTDSRPLSARVPRVSIPGSAFDNDGDDDEIVGGAPTESSPPDHDPTTSAPPSPFLPFAPPKLQDQQFASQRPASLLQDKAPSRIGKLLASVPVSPTATKTSRLASGSGRVVPVNTRQLDRSGSASGGQATSPGREESVKWPKLNTNPAYEGRFQGDEAGPSNRTSRPWELNGIAYLQHYKGWAQEQEPSKRRTSLQYGGLLLRAPSEGVEHRETDQPGPLPLFEKISEEMTEAEYKRRIQKIGHVEERDRVTAPMSLFQMRPPQQAQTGQPSPTNRVMTKAVSSNARTSAPMVERMARAGSAGIAPRADVTPVRRRETQYSSHVDHEQP